jgi:hypothetical protein
VCGGDNKWKLFLEMLGIRYLLTDKWRKQVREKKRLGRGGLMENELPMR